VPLRKPLLFALLAGLLASCATRPVASPTPQPTATPADDTQAQVQAILAEMKRAYPTLQELPTSEGFTVRELNISAVSTGQAFVTQAPPPLSDLNLDVILVWTLQADGQTVVVPVIYGAGTDPDHYVTFLQNEQGFVLPRDAAQALAREQLARGQAVSLILSGDLVQPSGAVDWSLCHEYTVSPAAYEVVNYCALGQAIQDAYPGLLRSLAFGLLADPPQGWLAGPVVLYPRPVEDYLPMPPTPEATP